MCLSAGYFAATVPPVILIVWGRFDVVRPNFKLTCCLVLQKYYLRTSRQMRLLDLEAKSPLYSHFIESLAGLVEIRAFGWGENFLVSRALAPASFAVGLSSLILSFQNVA